MGDVRMKDKGFTLIELIVTLILLATVGTIIIISVNSNNQISKKSSYNKFEAKILSSAETFVDLDKSIISELGVDKKNVKVLLRDLIQTGLLNSDLKNPYTNEVINEDDYVLVYIDEKSGLIKYEYKTGDELVDNNDEGIYLSVVDIKLSLNKLIASIDGIDNVNQLDKYYRELKDYGNYKLKLYSSSDFIDEYEQYQLKVDKITPHEINGVGDYKIHYSWVNNKGVRKVAVRKLTIDPSTCNYVLTAKNVKIGSTHYQEYKRVYTFSDNDKFKKLPDFEMNGYDFLGVSVNGKFVDKTKTDNYKIVCNGDNPELVCTDGNCETPDSICENGKKCIRDSLVIRQKTINVTLITNEENASFSSSDNVKSKNYKMYYMNPTTETVTIYNRNNTLSYFGPEDYTCMIDGKETPNVYLNGWDTGFTKSSPGGNQVVSVSYDQEISVSDDDITCEIKMSPIDCNKDKEKGREDSLNKCNDMLSLFHGKKLSLCAKKGDCGGQTYIVRWTYDGRKRFNYVVNPKYFSKVTWNVGGTYKHESFVESPGTGYEEKYGDGAHRGYHCAWNNKYEVVLVDAVTGIDYKSGTGGSIEIEANYAHNLYVEARWYFKPTVEKANCEAMAWTDAINLTIR